ncbi:aminotransferase class V-fold PLP-dependent enzyme [Nocardia sp. CDC153]|uniref:pyridoxal-phosphate-dependent aminotransferase family protein n=1 Tax=Nocardia sp. CDC153 TaxID=3112167 RepID=UPI002DB8A886|nr:aminotransferase class V-fold PLP-dependent enzyme [Nocardia sp. CDC153]MEC3952775.1 aminotransferase class V-fold PLP-dependent enzyme [Nocardia sp. CDC153]
MYGDATAGPVLLNPGPAGTSERVKNALLRGDLCHRETEFTELLNRLRLELPRALDFPRTYESVLVTGSGTAAMEMAVTGAVRSGRELLVLSNGVYGERLLAIARAHGITAHEVGPEGPQLHRWTTPIDPAWVERALEAHPRVDAVVCVHHETTTGLINPVREIGEVVARHRALFVVDAISSTGNEELNLADVGIDILCGTANKGLHGLPGLSFLLCGPAGLDRIAEAPARGFYNNAATHLAGQRRGDVPFTPAVQICYALDEALAEFAERGGRRARVALYRERAVLVRSGFARLGLEILVDPPHRANSVSTLRLPANVTYRRLHDELAQRGYLIYAGQGGLAAGHFRICTFGEIPWERLEALEFALDAALLAARD